jgi:hypothetical protein
MNSTRTISRRTWLRQTPALVLGASATLWIGDSRRAAAAQWPDERTAGIFRCHADFSLEHFEPLLAELGELEADLARDLEVAPPREEVHVFLFERKETYEAYLKQYFPKVPARKALYIKGRGPGMVFAYRSGELEVDVRHEATHALLHASLTDLPLWLDEGLAEYYETARDERVAGSPYVHGVRWNVRLGYVPELRKLEKLRDLSDMGANEYRDAWAWVHYLLHSSPTTHRLLRRYLAQHTGKISPGELSDWLRREVADPEAQFSLYYRRWNVVQK